MSAVLRLFLLPLLAAISANGQVCDDGFNLWEKQCYNFHFMYTQLPYKQAYSLCNALGSHLVTVESEKENKYIGRMRGVNSFWLGLRRDGDEWKWSDNSPYDYTNWDFLEPNKCCGDNVTCVKANWLLRSGKWSDVSCKEETGIICKYNPAFATSTQTTTTQATSTPTTTIRATLNSMNNLKNAKKSKHFPVASVRITGSAPKPCVAKSYGTGQIVCVCNATYCDDFPEVGVLKPHHAIIFKSSKSGKRFEKKHAIFSYRRRSSKDSKKTYINLNSKKKYQKIIGFGGSFTDAVGINLNSLTSTTRDSLLEAYFSQKKGLRYTLGSVPIASNSFSVDESYSYDEVKDDFELKQFNLTEQDFELKIPYIKQAKLLTENKLKLFATPWSAPGWMKESGEMMKDGKLKKDKKYQTAWANYLLKFLEEYSKYEVPMWALSVQHQPQGGNQSSRPTMFYTSEMQKNFVKDYLGPILQNSTVGKKVVLMIFDDFRELLPDWVEKVLVDESVRKYVSGIAVQWYQQNNSLKLSKTLTEVNRKYPDKFILGTEASNGYRADDAGPSHGNWTRAELYAKDIIQDLLHFASGWTDFNLCLDVEGGPSLTDTPRDAPILVNSEEDAFYKQPMYYSLAHFSKFLEPGSVRIDSKLQKENEHLHVAAFSTPKNQKVLILINEGDLEQSLLVSDRSMSGRKMQLELEPHSIATVLWKEKPRRNLRQ